MPKINPVYLGDGLYASLEAGTGYICLHNGDHRSPPVAYFEPRNLKNFIKFAQRAWDPGTVQPDREVHPEPAGDPVPSGRRNDSD